MLINGSIWAFFQFFSQDGVGVSASSSCRVQKEFPQICEVQWDEEYCHFCDNSTSNFAPESIFDNSENFWSSAIFDTDFDKVQSEVVVDFRGIYEFSGFFIHLGPGVAPARLEIFFYDENDKKIEEKNKFHLWHVVNFDGSCEIDDSPNDDSQILCQNEPNIPNQEFYVNLLSRRPSQEKG